MCTASEKTVADVPPQVGSIAFRHYFLTYKQSPDAPKPTVEIAEVYGRLEALETIKVSLADYDDKYGQLQNLFGPKRWGRRGSMSHGRGEACPTNESEDG